MQLLLLWWQWLRLVMQLLRWWLLLLLLMEVMVMQLILLLAAHFQVHVLPPAPSASAPAASASTSALHIVATYGSAAQFSKHAPGSVRLGHGADAGPPPGPWRAFSLGSGGLSAPLLGPVLRHEGV